MLQLEELEEELELDLLGLFLLLMSPSSFCRGTSKEQSREVQGQLRRMKQALMYRLEISFAPAPPRDVLVDDSKTNDDLDD
ncbi:hypothetical protein Scep_009514 [Stephania cephalantha]|uniref:Uncharacterized protein n=1 Tax=Stephania cephalantha TaxID=152367 RepID=A0AAP0JUS2_9MAGN